MRVPPNLKYLFAFIGVTAIIILASVFLPRIIPNIGSIVVNIVSIAMMVVMVFVIGKPFLMFLYARADGIFEVYMDLSEKGLHIFTYHLNSGGDGYGDSTRDVQHYFIAIETGKVYFRKMFSHLMTPTSGRSGWGDFYGFEESVLQSDHLPLSMQKLSAKSHLDLKLGRKLTPTDDEYSYEIHHNEFTITIKKYSTLIDEGLRVTAVNRQNGRKVWKKRI